MKKITYIFSGFSVEEHFGKEVSRVFQKDLKDCKNIIFIPFLVVVVKKVV